jgi:hypothetical protein
LNIWSLYVFNLRFPSICYGKKNKNFFHNIKFSLIMSYSYFVIFSSFTYIYHHGLHIPVFYLLSLPYLFHFFYYILQIIDTYSHFLNETVIYLLGLFWWFSNFIELYSFSWPFSTSHFFNWLSFYWFILVFIFCLNIF